MKTSPLMLPAAGLLAALSAGAVQHSAATLAFGFTRCWNSLVLSLPSSMFYYRELFALDPNDPSSTVAKPLTRIFAPFSAEMFASAQ